MKKLLVIFIICTLFGTRVVPVVSGGEANTMGNQPPTVTITYPIYGEEPSHFNFTGTAYDPDGTVEKVEIKLGHGEWQLANGTTSWYFNFTKRYPDVHGWINGAYTLYARSYDGINYSNTASVRFPVGNVVTHTEITSPSHNETVSGTVIIRGTASDLNGNDTIVQIEIEIISLVEGWNKWHTANGTTNWYYEWDTTTVDNGTYHVLARGCDEEECSNVMPYVRVIVNNKKDDGGIAGFEMVLLLGAVALVLILTKRRKSNL